RSGREVDHSYVLVVTADEAPDAGSDVWKQREQYQENCRGGEAAQPPEGIRGTGSGRGPHLLGGVLDGFAECDVIRGRWNARFGGAGLQMAAARFHIR